MLPVSIVYLHPTHGTMPPSRTCQKHEASHHRADTVPSLPRPARSLAFTLISRLCMLSLVSMVLLHGGWHGISARWGVRRARGGLGRWGMDVNPVPGQVFSAGRERNRSQWVLIPPGVLIVALYTIPDFHDGEHPAHHDGVPEGSYGTFHRDTVRWHRHDIRHLPHI